MTEYYYLKHNEIIREGDEVDVAADGWRDEKWVPTRCAGQRAPDPQYPAHRRYRRKLTPTNPEGETIGIDWDSLKCNCNGPVVGTDPDCDGGNAETQHQPGCNLYTPTNPEGE